MDIKKKQCDYCEEEKKKDEMYITIEGEFVFVIKYAYGFKHFNRTKLDFCNLECFNKYITETLMKMY